MKTFTIIWSRQDYGRLEIEANTEEEAREKFNQGDYKDADLNIKDGSMEIDSIER